jgi:hypothetical protein
VAATRHLDVSDGSCRRATVAVTVATLRLCLCPHSAIERASTPLPRQQPPLQLLLARHVVSVTLSTHVCIHE